MLQYLLEKAMKKSSSKKNTLKRTAYMVEEQERLVSYEFALELDNHKVITYILRYKKLSA